MTLGASALAEYNVAWGPLCDRTLSASGAEPMPLTELLDLADAETRRLWEDLSLGYATMAGLPALREGIADLYEECRAGDVLTFAGAQEGIYCLLRGLLEPGDKVVVITPCYEALLALPRAMGAEVTEVALRHEEGWRLDPARVEAALGPDTRLLVLNFPHNPTGATIAAGEGDRLLAAADAVGARVLSDEVFRLLDPAAPPPAADRMERAASLDVTAKAWGLGGVRVGWAATRDAEWLERARAVKGWTSICNGTPDEVLALAAIRARERIVGRNRAIVEGNLALVDAFFERHAGRFEWVRPRAGCLAFPRLVSGDVEALAEDLARRERTLLVPGRLFFGPQDHFRLGLGLRSLGEALDGLVRVLGGA